MSEETHLLASHRSDPLWRVGVSATHSHASARSAIDLCQSHVDRYFVEAKGFQASGERMLNGVVDHPEARRFELTLGDDVAAAYYRVQGDTVVLLHTEVPQRHAGQGVGTRLAEAVFDEIARTGRKAVAKCPFMSHFASKHPVYSRLIVG
jgi:predicted GNAT family acetyltransferase